MAVSGEKWYFTKDQLENSPSRKCGYDPFTELFKRQQTAKFIQDVGQKLKVSQLCINTAIVYMHRFYVFHSFTKFQWHQLGLTALMLACKVEEQPRKLQFIINAANVCRNSRSTKLDVKSEKYLIQSQDIIFNENILIETLGYDLAIEHPNEHVMRCCKLINDTKDLTQTSYGMVNKSLQLSTLCLQYKPTTVACLCINLAKSMKDWEISLLNENKEWFFYIDPRLNAQLLNELTEEFLEIFARDPSELKQLVALVDKKPPPRNHFILSDKETKNLRNASKRIHHGSQFDDKSGANQNSKSKKRKLSKKEREKTRGLASRGNKSLPDGQATDLRRHSDERSGSSTSASHSGIGDDEKYVFRCDDDWTNSPW